LVGVVVLMAPVTAVQQPRSVPAPTLIGGEFADLVDRRHGQRPLRGARPGPFARRRTVTLFAPRRTVASPSVPPLAGTARRPVARREVGDRTTACACRRRGP